QFADAMPQVVWTASSAGKIDYANQAWYETTGQTPVQDLDAVWYKALHPDDVEATLEIWHRSVADGAAGVTEYRLIDQRRQEYRWQLVQYQPIREGGGRIVKWYGTITDIHDRKSDEERMQKLANRLTMTLESITDAIFTLDRYWRFSYVNHESERVLQRPRRELLGQQMWDAFPLFKGSRFERACHRALDQQATQAVEEFYSPLSVWLEIRVYPFEDGLAIYYRDITDAKEAEARRRHEIEVQAGIVATQREIAAADLGSLQLMNLMAERAQSLTGATGGNVALAEGDDMVYRAGAGMLAPYVGLRLKRDGSLSGAAMREQTVLMCADAENDPRADREASRRLGVCSMIVAPLRSENRVIGVLQVVYDKPYAFSQSDVTNLQILVESLGTVLERRRVAEQLQESEAQYRLLFDHNPHPIWLIDNETLQILAVNAAAVRHYGYSEQEFLSMTLRDFRPEEDVPAMEQVVARSLLDEGFGSLGVWRHRRKDGSLLDVEISARNLVFAGRNARMAQANDVTARIAVERDLRRVSRAQEMLSACNEALVRAQDEARLLEDICRITVEIGGYRMAWVGYGLHDERRTLQPMASFGNGDEILDAHPMSWCEQEPSGRGPSGRTMRSGQVAITEDLAASTDFGPGLEVSLAAGYRSVVCLPLNEQGATFGIMNLYGPEATAFPADEIGLLQSLANDLAFGIAKLRAQAEQQRMHDAILKVAAGVSGVRGADFFIQLARNAADALGAAGAVIARYTAGGNAARTIAAVLDGQPVSNFTYSVADMPCEHLLHREQYIVAAHFEQDWPVSPVFIGMHPQAYAGRRLVNMAGQPLGILYLLFRAPLRQQEFITSALQIFAARAASEIEQIESDARIREQASLLDKAQDAIVVRGIAGCIEFWNKGAERLYGWTTEEALGRSISELLWDDPEASGRATAKVLRLGEWSGEITQRRKDGSSFSVEGHWTLIADDEGRPRSIFEINTDITERKLAEEKIMQLAFYDALTNLPNRILLLDRLHEALLQTGRNHHTGALLFIDLDNFKALNDTLGHDVGDLLLREVAQRLVSCVRETDTVARLGGDEFVLLLAMLAPSTQEAAIAVKSIGEKIITALNRPYELNG
ncbi:MAG TPA: PAS domain S-box protein, partial [Burkholderiaceae bacterium]